jgi:hypothetical protein
LSSEINYSNYKWGKEVNADSDSVMTSHEAWKFEDILVFKSLPPAPCLLICLQQDIAAKTKDMARTSHC